MDTPTSHPQEEPWTHREYAPSVRDGTSGRHSDDEPDGQSRQTSWASLSSADLEIPAAGTSTPKPLLYDRDVISRVLTASADITDKVHQMEPISSRGTSPYLGEALENLAHTMTNTDRESLGESYELRTTISRRSRRTHEDHRLSRSPRAPEIQGLAEENGSTSKPISQGIPPELPNFTSEIIFVLVCSAGQLLFAWFLGDVNVNQSRLREALGLKNTQLPWLVGAFNIANALSVVLCGSLTDLAPPKSLIVGAFAWLTAWNVVGAFSLTPARAVLFFIVRAMQGLAIGVLVSGSMSILGRVYNPGLRKTR